MEIRSLRSCEFHFSRCANRQRARMNNEKSKKFFTRVTRTLFQAQISISYNDAIQELKEFVAKKPAKDQRGFLIPWLEWSDDRRSHVFSCSCSEECTSYKPRRSNPPQMENDRRNTPISCRCYSGRH